MWPLRVYTRKKRAGQRLNLTPTPDLGPSATAEAPSGPGRRLAPHCWKGNRKAHGLQKIVEKAEQSGPGGSSSGLLSSQLQVTREKSLQENGTSKETQDEKIAPLSESVTDELQVDSSSSNSELVSGLSLQHNISSSLLSHSVTDSYTEYKSFEESLSSFSSPELFRRLDYSDWESPKLEEHVQFKNSTLLDTSKAVAIEKAPLFSNLSLILGTSSEDYKKCHRKTVMPLAEEKFSPKPKSTSNSESDHATCDVLAEKTYPSTAEKTKKKLGKDSGPRDTNFQTKLTSHNLKIKVPSSHQRSVLESNAGKSVTKVLLPQPLEPALNTNSSTRDKKSRGLLTSTPSSQTSGLEIDLSSVPKASFEELFPNVSNYVNSDEIVPVSSLQENSSNEDPSYTSELCCIIRASPGTRQMKSKGIIVKKKYSLPKDIPQDIIIKTNDRI